MNFFSKYISRALEKIEEAAEEKKVEEAEAVREADTGQ
jgi:hypothetical protein